MSHSHSFNGESVLASSSPCSQCRAATCPDCGDFKAGVWTCWDCSTERTKAMEEQDERDEAEIAAYKRSKRAPADMTLTAGETLHIGGTVTIDADGEDLSGLTFTKS